MEASLIPMFVANRAGSKPHELYHEQIHLKSKESKSIQASFGFYIIVGQPNGILVSSETGIYNDKGGSHEHTGSIELTNNTTEDQIVTFVRFIFQKT